MPEVLDTQTIDAAIADGSWQRAGDLLVLDREFRNFGAAWEWASRVAAEADAADHHPDILVHGWNKVRVSLSTHSAGGITELDVSLAARIEGIGD
jgi:4a-hydroxytetrahydrobiopterin dehydratase